MSLTRRQGIIAVLLPFFVSSGSSEETWAILELPEKTPPGPMMNCHSVPESDYVVRCEGDGSPKPYRFAIEVRYKNRVVRLTGDEIMDALENRPRNEFAK